LYLCWIKGAMNKIPFIIFTVMVVLFALIFYKGKDPAQLESVMIGRDVPVFNLKSPLENEQGFSSEDLKAQVSIVNVFASWCIGCLAEHKVLENISKEEAVSLYGLNYKDKPENVKKWLDKHGNIYKLIGSDRNGRVAIDWGVYGVPETFIVDENGVIRYKHVGPVTQDVYEETFKPLLKILKK